MAGMDSENKNRILDFILNQLLPPLIMLGLTKLYEVVAGKKSKEDTPPK